MKSQSPIPQSAHFDGNSQGAEPSFSTTLDIRSGNSVVRPYWRRLIFIGLLSGLAGGVAWLEGRPAGEPAAASINAASVIELQDCQEHGRECVQRGAAIWRTDPARAASLFRAACDAGDALGCNDLGVLYKQGYGLPRDPVRAADMFGRACSGGQADGCNNLGVLQETGEGTTQDLKGARSLYENACQVGLTLACSNLAGMSERGRGTPRLDRLGT